MYRSACLFILAILVMLAACSSSNRDEGYVYFRLNSNPTTLDPAYVADVTGGTLDAKLFNGLVKIDNELKIVPDIAGSWKVSGDGLTYTFYLRKGVTFSNGREINASDFLYSFHRVMDPANNCPNTWVLEKIRGSEAFRKGEADTITGLRTEGDHMLRISLEKPFAPFLSLMTMVTAYVVPREEVERYGETFGFHPVGSGPFTLKKWVPDSEIVLEARNDYFEGAPHVKGLVYRVVREDLTSITEFELGNLDILTLPAPAFRKYAKDPKWSRYLLSRHGLNTYYLGFNCQKPPFDRKIVRQAVAQAIDVEKILDKFYEGKGRLAKGPVPPELREWSVKRSFHYDPGSARKLLQSSGLELPYEIDFYITADQTLVDMAEIIQYYLEDVGLKVSIKQLEWSAYKAAISKGDPNMFYLSWWADYPDPENFLYPLFHSSNLGPAGNRTRYVNPEVDTLIEKGQSALSRSERNRAYSKAEQLIVDDIPWVPLWHANEYILRQKWVTAYNKPPVYSSEKGTDIVISEPTGTEDGVEK